MPGERPVTEYRIVGDHPLVGSITLAKADEPNLAGVYLREAIRDRPDWTNLHIESREVGPWVDVPTGGKQDG